ncbi:MAG: NAD(P)-dependent oxidoreductase [Rikenellaceae bacterium]|nr:NAD(P)-dependent oxidoreductase [Rikenellaceae bacterium]
MSKKRVLLTGGTGTMGWATVQEFLNSSDRFELTLLVQPSRKNRKKLAPIADKVNIVWGDLRNYDDVLRSVNEQDYVLHLGGMVSPKADYYPNKTRQVNITAAQNIVRAVKAQPNPDAVKVVYIGSVAQTGDRNAPIHWGRCGDPIYISTYDHYAISKVAAERIFAESGLRHWVSLRQSGILYPGILKNYDPIMFHVPIQGVLEWATVEDSGRLMLRICDSEVGDEFWRRFYNISSGPSYRLTNYEFECLLLDTISCPAPEKIFNSNWFTLKNFHGQWYTDGERLEELFHFRANTSCEEYFRQMKRKVAWYYSLAKIVPPCILKIAMRAMAYKKRMGAMDWIKSGNQNRISAYFGSIEEWKAIPDWDKIDKSRPSETPTLLNHGYDENKPESELTLEDMQQAAEYRGGKCLSESMTTGDMYTPLEWECHFGHKFTASPRLILHGGHWCPECEPTPWNYSEIARVNPFFAQVWYANHSPSEKLYYDEDIFKEFNE